MDIRLPDNCSCQWFAALRLGARISLVRLKGQVPIRPGKTHQERALPLSQEVGNAITDYI